MKRILPTVRLAACAALLFGAAALARAQDEGPNAGPNPGQNSGQRRGPPPTAYAACAGAAAMGACSFETPNGTKSGVCASFSGRLACVPEGMPLPPPDQEQPRAEELPTAQAALPAAVPTAAPVTPPAPAAPAEAAPASAPPAAAAPPPVAAGGGLSWPLAAGLAALAAGIGFFLRRPRAEAAAAAPSLPTAAPAAAPAPRMTLGPVGPNGGSLIAGHYETRRQLGAGGMGMVYEAVDMTLDRVVALKRLRPEIGRTARGRERFLTEARTVAKLQHPNIVGIHAVLEEGEDVYLVLEYVDGATLDSVLAGRKRLEIRELLTVLDGVSAAIDYAHANKVIHRDLKPSNIMLDRHGRVRVMDFGIAHQAKITVSQLTNVEAFGTLAYMPPEQEMGRAVRESDVYAFGVLAYEALLGDLPFPGPNFRDQKLERAFERPSRVREGLAAAVDAAFEQALDPEPKKRHATTSEFVKTLRGALGAA